MTGTLGYSYLFYKQNAGINFLVFTILLITIFLIRNRELAKQKKWLWAAGLCLVSAVSIFINSSALAIIANCISVVLLSAFTVNTKTSAVFSFLFGLYSLASSAVWMIIDAIRRNSIKAKVDEAEKKGYKVFAVLCVIFLSFIFFILYKEANPLFAENTKWLNLDFISFRWMSFTFGGLLLIYPLFYHRSISAVTNWENNFPINCTSKFTVNKKIETERFAGILLFVFLNIMLLILNGGDISTLWLNFSLPKGITHSDFVHNGISMIILSIVIASGLIMFLYRKDDKALNNTKWLKFLVYAWIFQNLVMLFSTVFRNHLYIQSFNLTYKRIGVYVWITLAAIGLIITFSKIISNRTNWYLIKNNCAVWFTILSLSSVVNWDLLITRYNLSNKPFMEVDYHYLLTLSDSNIPELMQVTKHKDFSKINNNKSSYYSYENWDANNFSALLRTKIYYYLSDYTNDWQSFDLRDKRITQAILNK